MTSLAVKIQRHQATFVEPMQHAKKRADWCLKRLLDGVHVPVTATGRSLIRDIAAFDRAAEEHQLAAHREAVARKHWGIPDD
jgi:hypothetical protein